MSHRLDGLLAGSRLDARLLTTALVGALTALLCAPGAARAATAKAPKTVVQADPEIEGVPMTGAAGVTETVDQLMEREKSMPIVGRLKVKPEYEFERDNLKKNPDAPAVSQWPPLPPGATPEAGATLFNPQTTGVSFQAIFLNPPTFNESGNIPPDSMGDVGPTQILAAANGRFKIFDKTGVLGALNVSDTTFWASLGPSGGVSDPEVRYDRLSGRWFVLAIDLAAINNKIMIAVSSGPTITNTSSFTFFSFTTSVSGDGANFCDYPSLGVDANALYTGCNMFTSAGAFSRTSAYVVRKSSITGGGPIVVTGFGGIATGAVAGPYAPRGVDNDDPQATQGYIIGVDTLAFSTLQIRRVTNPGATPTLSANITLTVPTTTAMSRQLSPGNTTQTTGIDTSDDRIFMASIHKNKLTGVSSLWTSQGVEVTTACAGSSSALNRRIGARWYEIGSLTGTPTLTQSGTLCSAVPGANTVNSERGYIYSTVAETGQGHMALGATFASSAQNENPGVAVSGRLRTDTAGATQAATVAQSGTGTYRLCDGAGGGCPRNRWGDYSFTDVDPNDDQTVWTFQEYALDATGSGFAGNWAIRAVQLKAPPPATPASVSAAVCTGLSSASVTVTGTSVSGSEYFDPGPDTGGPGFANHIGAAVSGGVTVNSVAIVVPGSPSTTPVTQVTLNVNTTAASAGTKSVTITNPDGQSATGNGILTVNAPAGAPTAGNDGPLCAGATLHLTASTIPGATYSWTGPNGFTSSLQNPTIVNVQTVNAGTYSVTATTGGCAAGPAGQTTVSVTANGGACSDGSACTQTDTCSGGTCVGSNPVICTPLDQCHAAGTCSPATGICSNPNAPNGTSCGDAGTECTNQDTCQSGLCQDNGFKPSGTSCGSSADTPCDNPDTCNGSGVCQTNNEANGTFCGDAGTPCTNQDTCQSGVCQDNGFQPSGTACGSSANTDCDNPDTCNGSGSCQANNESNGTLCGTPGVCENQDTCQSGVCQDAGFSPSGTSCGSAADTACDDPDTCNGSGSCQSNNAPNGTLCGDAGTECTNQDTCQSGSCHDNGYQPSGTACDSNADTECDDPDTCDGAGSCQLNHAADGTLCGDAGTECTNQDTCSGGTCQDHGYLPSGTACGSSADTDCDDPDTCNGTGGCQANPATDGTLCGDAGTACTNQDTCLGGACHDNGYQPSGAACGDPAESACDHADTCNGAGTCQVNYAPSGSVCSDGLGCTTSDTCNGSGACTGTPIDCSDGSVCSVDTCLEPSGDCDHSQASGLCSIAGLVRYYRDHLTSAEPSAKPVPDEDVSRLSSTEPTQISTTDSTGQYGFTSEAGDITLTPQPVRLLTDEGECRSAISSSDATLIARAAVHLVTLTSNQTIAADVSNNGAVTSFDASLVAQRTVAASCTSFPFPVGTATGSDWAFRPVSRNFTPLQGGEDYNFVGIVYGDVTGNWVAPFAFSQGEVVSGDAAIGSSVPATGEPLADMSLRTAAALTPTATAAPSSGPGAVLYLAGAPLQNPDGSWEVVLGLQGSDGVLGLDLGLRYDPARVHVVGVEGTGLGAGLTFIGNDAPGSYFLAGYGVEPLRGSGSLIRVIYTMSVRVDGVPFSVDAQANEGRIPISWSPGVPGGARDPNIGVDR